MKQIEFDILEEKGKIKDKFVMIQYPMQLSYPVYYDKEGKKMDVAGCGCGGSMYYCDHCKKLIVHEIRYHNKKNWIIIDFF